MSHITREEFFARQDITTKEVTVPETIPVWAGTKFFIKLLTREQQDKYNNRMFGNTSVKQDGKSKQQNISGVSIYGHDAWLCVQGVVDENGNPFFKNEDMEKVNKKSGELVGWLASEIVQFSGMAGDVSLEDELKNS